MRNPEVSELKHNDEAVEHIWYYLGFQNTFRHIHGSGSVGQLALSLYMDVYEQAREMMDAKDPPFSWRAFDRAKAFTREGARYTLFCNAYGMLTESMEREFAAAASPHEDPLNEALAAPQRAIDTVGAALFADIKVNWWEMPDVQSELSHFAWNLCELFRDEMFLNFEVFQRAQFAPLEAEAMLGN